MNFGHFPVSPPPPHRTGIRGSTLLSLPGDGGSDPRGVVGVARRFIRCRFRRSKTCLGNFSRLPLRGPDDFVIVGYCVMSTDTGGDVGVTDRHGPGLDHEVLTNNLTTGTVDRLLSYYHTQPPHLGSLVCPGLSPYETPPLSRYGRVYLSR